MNRIKLFSRLVLIPSLSDIANRFSSTNYSISLLPSPSCKQIFQYQHSYAHKTRNYVNNVITYDRHNYKQKELLVKTQGRYFELVCFHEFLMSSYVNLGTQTTAEFSQAAVKNQNRPRMFNMVQCFCSSDLQYLQYLDFV